ncbi:DMT family transporter [Vibrio sp. SCSIO 43137]|uniref:DMT family transporter n=1 Tax=Vibrio sp. SCSIO 43137 TaxID=3021011 RepID=UPI002307337A|nr:EamA family transporter [Vibrio sp. SCSIO 43137]WCE32534.1 EamA family transporter [Vibrio sp. SCSIO 43137]
MSEKSVNKFHQRSIFKLIEKKYLIYFILYSIVCLCWGTTWIGIKYATLSIPPLTASGLRFVIAFPFFLLIARVMKVPIFYPEGKTTFFWFITLVYFSIPYFLIGFASTQVSSGLISLLFSTMPIFIIIFSALFNDERCNSRQVAGILVGFTSLFFIILNQGISIGFTSYTGVIAVACAAALHGLCYVLTKKHGQGINVLTFNTLPVGIAGIGMTILGYFVEDWNVESFSQQSVFGLLYLGLIASVAGFLAYFYLLKRINPTILSYVFVIFPVVAIYIGARFAGEVVNETFIMLVILMLLGISYTKYHTPD